MFPEGLILGSAALKLVQNLRFSTENPIKSNETTGHLSPVIA
jgi:hypothetical protein